MNKRKTEVPEDEIATVRRVRHEISAECGHDVHKVAVYCQSVVEQLTREGKVHPKDTAKRNPPKGSKTKRK
jgi:hypothetical protein